MLGDMWRALEAVVKLLVPRAKRQHTLFTQLWQRPKGGLERHLVDQSQLYWLREGERFARRDADG
ncbi:hypothetical protein F6B41_23480 [Microbacterium lushaniae]|nr:hypothetical protein F6B41_23480 [Microbacterium lushaniae]